MFSQRTFSHNSQNFSCFIDSLLRFSLDYETTFQLEYFTKQQKETFFFVPSVRNWGKLFIFKKSRLAREDEKIDESEKSEKLLHSISCRCWRWWLLSLVVLSRRWCEMRERHAIFIFCFHFVCSSVQSFENSLEKRDEQRNEKLRKSSIFSPSAPLKLSNVVHSEWKWVFLTSHLVVSTFISPIKPTELKTMAKISHINSYTAEHQQWWWLW